MFTFSKYSKFKKLIIINTYLYFRRKWKVSHLSSLHIALVKVPHPLSYCCNTSLFLPPRTLSLSLATSHYYAVTISVRRPPLFSPSNLHPSAPLAAFTICEKHWSSVPWRRWAPPPQRAKLPLSHTTPWYIIPQHQLCLMTSFVSAMRHVHTPVHGSRWSHHDWTLPFTKVKTRTSGCNIKPLPISTRSHGVWMCAFFH